MKIYSIEFVRTIFCLAVIFFHIVMGNITPYTNGYPFYKWCGTAFMNIGIVVECFFIISGYFLMRSIQRRPDASFLMFVLSKICRLWPVFLVATIVTHFARNGIWAETFMNSLFLQMTGLSFSHQGTNWYVSALFWSFVFYFLLFKCVTDRYRRCLTVLLVSWAAYVINLQSHSPSGFGREVVFNFFPLGLLRGVAGVGLGVLIYELVETLKPYIKQKPDWRLTVLATGAELVAAVFLILHLFFREWTCKNHFVVVVSFAILLPLLVFNIGYLSRILNLKAWGVLGKYTFSMYVMQQAGFWLLRETLWKNTAFVTGHAATTLVLSVAVTAAIGVVAYYAIEIPGSKLLKSTGRLFKVPEDEEFSKR